GPVLESTMTNNEVARAFSLGLSGRALNLYSNSAQLISYGTIIAYWDAGLHINTRKYSVSTSRHHGLLWYAHQQADQKGRPGHEDVGQETKMRSSWRDGRTIKRAGP